MMYLEPISIDAAGVQEAVIQTADLSVLTYNIRGLPWPIARGRGEAIRQIGRELALMRREGRQPDVVLIQEGFRSEVADLVRESGYQFWARGPSRGAGSGKLTGAGLHVLSDQPIIDVARIAYSKCAGWDCLANKGAMLVRIAPPALPTTVDVVNTHLNSRKAAKAPLALTLAAHNAQTRELNGFIRSHRSPEAPIVVGGDFNVKKAPERYYLDALERPYTVVSEFCAQPRSGCGDNSPDATAEPWLKSQDLQAFDDGAVRVRPITTEEMFAETPRLSDHRGYLVRYRLSWNAAGFAAFQPSPSTTVRPRAFKGSWGVKVSWVP